MKILPLAPLVLLGSACADAPAAEADPAAVQALLAGLAAAEPVQTALDEQDRLKAERLLPSIEKMQPERINPSVAASLIGG